MRIQDWMTKDVVVTQEDTSMMRASRIMKERDIRRMPVVDAEGHLVGIISDKDIKEASPSKATSLDMHELYYLLSEIKVKDIMTKTPVALKGEDSIETAALIMLDKHFGGIPVVDADKNVVGIVTKSDIFKVLLDITGASDDGVQLAFELSNEKGSLKAVQDALREFGIRIISVLTSHKSENSRRVYIRVKMLGDASDAQKMIDSVKGKFNLLYWHFGR